MISTLIIAICTSILLILSILFFPTIKFKKITLSSYWIVTLIGAILLLIFHDISVKQIIEDITSNNSINPLKILILFFSMTILSIFLDEVGLFKYLASKASLLCKNSQLKLFFIFYFIISILTIFTSNDIVILTFTPFICYFCKNAKVNPIPYLIAEFAGSNTWSMMLLIGNPTNIYLATSNNITFLEYFKIMAFPTIISGFIELIVLLILFYKQLKKEFKVNDIQVEKIHDKFNLIIGIICLGSCLIFLVLSSYINIEMYLVALSFSIFLVILEIIVKIIRKDSNKYIINTLKRLPYALIPFVLSMFIIVSTLKSQGISKEISDLLGENQVIIKYGISSFFICNLINNIPMSVLYSTLPQMSDYALKCQAIYSTIIGSNIGAFLTPIGALAGIMFTNLIAKYEVKFSFRTFIKYGTIISFFTLLSALLTLSLIL